MRRQMPIARHRLAVPHEKRPLRNPDPETWRQLDETKRHNIVEEYHRRQKIRKLVRLMVPSWTEKYGDSRLRSLPREHGFPGLFVVADADQLAAAYQRQP